MAHFEHVSEPDLEVYLNGHLPERKESLTGAPLGEYTPCSVEVNNADEFVSALALLGDQQAIHDGRNKRREYRFVTDDPAGLQILNPLSADNLDVRILDVSKHGLRLSMRSNVEPGSSLKVRMKDYIAFGVARYCIPATEGFFVGVQIHDYVSRRSTPLGDAKSVLAADERDPWPSAAGQNERQL